MTKRLYRSRTEKVLGGVCGGLAEYINIDPNIVRLLFVFAFFAGCSGFFIYLVMWVITPLEPESAQTIIEVATSEEPAETTAQKAKKGAPPKQSKSE